MPSSGVHALLGIKVTSNLLVQATESIRTLKLPRREAVLTSNSVSEQPLPGGSQWYKKALTLTSSSSRFPTQAVYREAQQKEEGGSNSWGAWLRTGRRAKNPIWPWSSRHCLHLCGGVMKLCYTQQQDRACLPASVRNYCRIRWRTNPFPILRFCSTLSPKQYLEVVQIRHLGS